MIEIHEKNMLLFIRFLKDCTENVKTEFQNHLELYTRNRFYLYFLYLLVFATDLPSIFPEMGTLHFTGSKSLGEVFKVLAFDL